MSISDWSSDVCASDLSTALAARDDPDRVHDTGDVAEQRQQDVEPEMQPDADLQEDAEGRQHDGENDPDDVQGGTLLLKGDAFRKPGSNVGGTQAVPARRNCVRHAASPA